MQSHKWRPIAHGIFLLALPITGSANLPEDYITALKAELAEFENGEFQLPSSSPWIPQAGDPASDDGTNTLASFEAFLKSKFRGTYILFKTLPDWKKDAIWQDYKQTGDLGSIRSSIFAFRKKGRRAASTPAINNLPLDF